MKLAVLAGACLALVAAQSAPADPGDVTLPPVRIVQTAAAGPLRAALSFTRTDTRRTYDDAGRKTSYVQSVYTGFRLTVAREGRVVVSRLLAPLCRECTEPGGAGGKSIRLAKLDVAGDSYALVDLYTGGAHCCWVSLVIPTRASAPRPLVHLWGDPGYRLKDVDGDGVPEFLTADDAFAYAFTSFVASGLPVQVRRLEDGRLRDVTREFPALVRADAGRWLGAYQRERRQPDPDVRGLLAAYVADEYLLGSPERGWAVVDEAVQKGELDAPDSPAASYVRQLSDFLDRLGYAPG